MARKKFTIEDLDAIVDGALTPKPRKMAFPFPKGRFTPPKVATPELPKKSKLPKVR